MKNVNLFFMAFVGLLFTGCEADSSEIENSNGLQSLEYLSFGHMYGECFGEECVEMFRLDDTGLAEDERDIYPSRTEAYQGDFKSIEDIDRALFESLITDFPKELLDEDEIVLGCPDCADQGGYYLEISPVDGERRFWILDTNKSSIPAYAHDYTDAISNAIRLIND